VIHVSPRKMLAASRVVELVTEIAIFPVEQEMDKHRQRREEIGGALERRRPNGSVNCLLVHLNRGNPGAHSRKAIRAVRWQASADLGCRLIEVQCLSEVGVPTSVADLM